MQTGVVNGAITAARNVALNPNVAGQAAPFVGGAQGVLPKVGPSLDFADAIKGISQIATA